MARRRSAEHVMEFHAMVNGEGVMVGILILPRTQALLIGMSMLMGVLTFSVIISGKGRRCDTELLLMFNVL